MDYYSDAPPPPASPACPSALALLRTWPGVSGLLSLVLWAVAQAASMAWSAVVKEPEVLLQAAGAPAATLLLGAVCGAPVPAQGPTSGTTSPLLHPAELPPGPGDLLPRVDVRCSLPGDPATTPTAAAARCPRRRRRPARRPGAAARRGAEQCGALDAGAAAAGAAGRAAAAAWPRLFGGPRAGKEGRPPTARASLARSRGAAPLGRSSQRTLRQRLGAKPLP